MRESVGYYVNNFEDFVKKEEGEEEEEEEEETPVRRMQRRVDFSRGQITCVLFDFELFKK